MDGLDLLSPLGAGLDVVAARDVGEDLLRHPDGAPFLAHAAVVVDAQVARQAQGPGGEQAVAPVLAEVLVEPQEDLLRQVLSLLPRAREMERQIVDPPAVQLDQILPGIGLARGGAPGKEQVGGGHGGEHRISLLSP
jgi:hypothetical protein